MPLVPATLKAGLLKAFSKPYPQDAAAAAKNIADAYDAYAKLAMAGPYPFIPKGTEASAMQAPIFAALATKVGPGAAVAASIVAGFTAYWTGGFFATPAIPALGLPALQAGLVTLFSVNNNPKEVTVNTMAALLDTCTRTITSLDPTTGAPLPVV